MAHSIPPISGASSGESTRWSPQQVKALQQIDRWLKNPNSKQQVFTMFGFAGTGKTTLAQHIASQVDGPVLFAAFTGKAASVLASKGCDGASTLHRLVYSVQNVDDAALLELRDAVLQEEDPAEQKRLQRELRALQQRLNHDRYSINPESPLASADLLILDECSMVNDRLGRDVLSFGCPVLVLGDPGQLPPPQGAGFFSGEHVIPDVMLTEIHRQAADNPIIRLAHAVRTGETTSDTLYDGKRTFHESITRRSLPECVRYWRQLAAEERREPPQLLTGDNNLRRALNVAARGAPIRDRTRAPRAGEPIVFLRNSPDYGVFNGQLATVLTDVDLAPDETHGVADVMVDGRTIYSLPLDFTVLDEYASDGFVGTIAPPHDRNLVPADYGYGLTVHKAQGSEFPDVILVDSGFGHWNTALRRQWFYTAVTRAQETFTHCVITR